MGVLSTGVDGSFMEKYVKDLTESWCFVLQCGLWSPVFITTYDRRGYNCDAINTCKEY